jgi:hypothetical protein
MEFGDVVGVVAGQKAAAVLALGHDRFGNWRDGLKIGRRDPNT